MSIGRCKNMEKVLNSYESLFIVDLSNGEEAAKATVTKFTDLIAKNGEIVDIADWGKRRLAYLINDMSEGYYTVVTFKSEPSFPVELERLYNIDESVMRSIVLKLDHEPVAKAAESAPAAEASAEATETDAE
jgi:small subunit ribosomal protein S6